MAARRRFRENVRNFDDDDWSDWQKALVPEQEDEEDYYRDRNVGEPGFILPDAYDDAFENYNCGIYEWKIQSEDDPDGLVVYVGSTCTSKRGSLRTRIRQYCRNGSHKEELFNEALESGYELWVRVKPTNCKGDAEDEENDLLDRYNYAWNERNNGDIRNVI